MDFLPTFWKIMHVICISSYFYNLRITYSGGCVWGSCKRVLQMAHFQYTYYSQIKHSTHVRNPTINMLMYGLQRTSIIHEHIQLNIFWLEFFGLPYCNIASCPVCELLLITCSQTPQCNLWTVIDRSWWLGSLALTDH